eukprot:GGOE01013844.1.p1 GENE.GGOE01013844.1~~GGOE01013844.1.p1  ORF type:complete len:639 (-),score=237.70 GGOE01013844.1:406-2322(-)
MSIRKSFPLAKRVLLGVAPSVVSAGGKPSLGSVGALVDQVASLVKDSKKEAILVSAKGPTPAVYEALFGQYGLKCALVKAASAAEAKAEISSLLASNVIPIVSQDADAATAQLAQAISADLLVLLSNVDGVFSDAPEKKGAQLLSSLSSNQAVQFGGAGMQEKVAAALSAAQQQIKTVIANGKTENVVTRILKGENVGTVVTAQPDTGLGPLQICERARKGLRDLRTLSGEKRTELLKRVSKTLVDKADEILAANEVDLDNAKKTNLDKHLLARLKLTKPKLETLAQGILDIAAQPDPIGKVIAAREVTPGLVLTQETVPLGVLLVIFESRPDALPQVVSLAIRSGNPLILKGGTEATNSNKCLLNLIHQAIAPELGPHCYQMVEGREDVASLMSMNQYIDLVIPRGSNSLVQSIQRSTKIPVMGHADGICHVFVDTAADLEKAKEIVVDAKTDYPAACNAMETLLIHEDLVKSGKAVELVKAAQAGGVQFYAGPRAQSDLKELNLKPTSVFSHEYGSNEALVEVVPSLDGAVDWITKYGSSHTDAIVTEDKAAAEKFLSQVDSADVFHNATTRMADGYRFGLGAEVGISTGRLHARGPVGVHGLLTTKWVIRSSSSHTLAQHNKGQWKYTHKPLNVQ